MFAQFFRKTGFYDKYMQLYAMRQAMANLQMEDDKTDLLSPIRTQEMYNNVIAFENILAKSPDKVSPYDLIDIASDINGSTYNKGFRRTQVEVKTAKNFFPIPPREVPQAIYSAFNAYHNIWIDLPVFLREAKIHIELVRIQPFEDGNKRSTRILTNYNLCKQNKAPIIIPGVDTDKYFAFIDNYDADGLAKYFRDKSEEEFQIMLELYRSTYGNEFTDDAIINIKENDIKIFTMAKRIIDDIGKIEH